jgi:hypothetical protein
LKQEAQMPLSETPRTDTVDNARAPDTNGHEGWKMAYFAMLTFARAIEKELVAVEKHSVGVERKVNELRAKLAEAEKDAELLSVPEGELCFLIEQTSTEDGRRRYWDGNGYGWDAMKAARYPTKEGARRSAEDLSTVHGRPEICEHLFHCGVREK